MSTETPTVEATESYEGVPPPRPSIKRPWIGLGFSLAVHAGLLALLVAAVWRDESLPALIVDLREGFAPAVASIRSRVSEARHGQRPTSPAPPPRGVQAKEESAPAPAPGPPEPPAPAPLLKPASPPSPVPSPSALPSLPSLPSVPTPPAAVERREPLLAAPPAPAAGPAESPLKDFRVAAAPPLDPPTGGGGSSTDRSSQPSAVSVAPAQPTGGASTARVDPRGGGGTGTGPLPAGTETGVAVRREGSGTPGPTVAAASTGGGTGVGAEYAAYLTALRQRIQESLRYPASARRRGVSGTVNVEILILPNGTVGNVTVLDSSTHPVLDDAALDTIRALPRMPLPPELPSRALRVRVPVVFQIK